MKKTPPPQPQELGPHHPSYWQYHEYEHAAEEMALRRLLQGKHFKHAVDVGGGYGRLTPLLKTFADTVTLAEPRPELLLLAKDHLKGHAKIKSESFPAHNLTFKDGSIDLITMIRGMHHLLNPSAEFTEISRVLSPDGYAVIEVANYAHGINRLRYFLRGERLPAEPVDSRSAAARRKDNTPFVNHNPHTVMKQLAHAGLKVERSLSVCSLRAPAFKKMFSKSTMMAIEDLLQPTLASAFIGPSIFFLVRKV